VRPSRIGNLGDVAAEMAAAFPTAAIWYFEPVPHLVDQVRRRFLRDARFHICAVAITAAHRFEDDLGQRTPHPGTISCFNVPSFAAVNGKLPTDCKVAWPNGVRRLDVPSSALAVGRSPAARPRPSAKLLRSVGTFAANAGTKRMLKLSGLWIASTAAMLGTFAGHPLIPQQISVARIPGQTRPADPPHQLPFATPTR
jgi:hypothetical protein